MKLRLLPAVLLSLLLTAAAMGLKTWNAGPRLALSAVQQASAAFAAAQQPVPTCSRAPMDCSRALRWVGSPGDPPPVPHPGPCLWPAGLWVPSPHQAGLGVDHPEAAQAAIAELERLHVRNAVTPYGTWLCRRAIALETLRHQGEAPAGRFRGLWPSSTVFERWAMSQGDRAEELSGVAPLGEAPLLLGDGEPEPPAELVATLEGLILANPIGFCSVGLGDRLRSLKAIDEAAARQALVALDALAVAVDDAVADHAGAFPPAPFGDGVEFVPLPGAPGFEVDLEESGFGSFTLSARRVGELVTAAMVEHRANTRAYRAMYRRGLRDGTLSDAAAVRVGPLPSPWPAFVTTRGYARLDREREADPIEREVAKEQRAGTLRLPPPLARAAPGVLEVSSYSATQLERDELTALLRIAVDLDERVQEDHAFPPRAWERSTFLVWVPDDGRLSVQYTRVGEGRATLELLRDSALTGAVFAYNASPAARRAAGLR